MKVKIKRFNNCIKRVSLTLIFLFLFLIFSFFVRSASPHNVNGTVLTDGNNGVGDGITVRIDDLVSDTNVSNQTSASNYSANITGDDDDFILVNSSNSTYFGLNGSFLLKTTTTVNAVLKYKRTGPNPGTGPPSPHNVDGRVLTNSTNGVQNGIPVKIEDLVTSDFVSTVTDAPDIPELLGIYSATINNASDDDFILIKSWNSTHYGFNSSFLEATTTTVNVVLKYKRPSETNVTITLPLNNSVRNTTDVFNVTANVTILGSDATNCNATISFSNDVINITFDQNFTNQLGDINLGSSKTTKWNVSGVKDGTSNITVKAQCSSDGKNFDGVNINTISTTINDTTIPIIDLVSPANNSFFNLQESNITFRYNISENTGIKNCSLYFNNIINQTNMNLEVNTLLNFTINNTPLGTSSWFISCFDNSTNLNQGNSSVRILNIDGIKPNITLLLPLNNSVMRNNSISFQYNITDNYNVTNCSLILNQEVKFINYSITQNITNYFNVTIPGNDYNWSINCTDLADNVGSSGHFVLISSDLKVNSSDIVFSKDAPAETETIEINASIFNLGIANLTQNAIVQFFENDPDINGIQIGDNKSVNVSAKSNVTVSVNYTVKVGKVDIFVIVDPPIATNGSIIEINETNNEANRSLSISAYHTYYGDVISKIFLSTVQNFSVYSWFNLSLTGSIFASDSDSSIDFNNLTALSRNLSNNLTMNDFEDLDIALNITSLADSINRSYVANDAIKDTANFTILNKNVTDVPIVNSTNTSNFVTGILWDTNDTNTGQFNGSQDVVFITRINKRSLGSYGAYSYEIKVPANLKKYLNPNLRNTITFHTELT